MESAVIVNLVWFLLTFTGIYVLTGNAIAASIAMVYVAGALIIGVVGEKKDQR
jgi:hypothetical protein